jgi:hypothetical protein
MAVLVLLVLAGCGATPAQREVGQQEMQRISDEMRSMDGVTEVESAYQTTIAACGIVGTVRPGTAAEPLLDGMERLVWTSCLDPLGSIALVLNEEGAPPNSFGVQRSYPTEADREALARTYGPRPVC